MVVEIDLQIGELFDLLVLVGLIHIVEEIQVLLIS